MSLESTIFRAIRKGVNLRTHADLWIDRGLKPISELGSTLRRPAGGKEHEWFLTEVTPNVKEAIQESGAFCHLIPSLFTREPRPEGYEDARVGIEK